MKKVILFNIFILVFTLFCIEVISLFIYYQKVKSTLELKNNAGFIQEFRYTKANKYTTDYFSFLFQKHISENTSKRPIVLLGCSYAEGTGLEDEQNLSYKLFKKTSRSVFERAIAGGGPQLALHQFETGEMKQEVPDAEYIIYVYCDYHLNRLYGYQMDYISTEVNQRYKLKDNKLVKIKQPDFPFYYSFFFVKNIQQLIENYSTQNEYETYSLFNAVMSELLTQAKNNYNDVKFVILLYPSANLSHNTNEIMPQFEIEKLKSMGFIVINAEELTTLPIRREEYRIGDKDHPSEKAWDAVIDNLIKELNL